MKLTRERDGHHKDATPGALRKGYEARPGRRDTHFSNSTAAKMTAATPNVIVRSTTERGTVRKIVCSGGR